MDLTRIDMPMRRPCRHRRGARAIGLTLSAVLLAALPAVAEGRIVEGRSVAGVQLGDSQARVRAVLGAPERGSNVLNYRYIGRHGLGVYFIAGRAFEITVLRRPQATRKGIRVGSTRKAVTAAYPGVACRRAAVGGGTFECRLRGRHRGRGTETLFTTKKDRVVSIAVHFA